MIFEVSGILTLRFDSTSLRHFEEMRQRYFPPERNMIPAHLTLFHSLPMTESVRAILEETAATTRIFATRVSGLRFLGRGVAYDVDAPQLTSLHRQLSHSFAAHLIAQDRQKFKPHVVIQNKSTQERATALLAMLQAGFRSFTADAQGLDLWHYRGGPWELAHQFDFQQMQPVEQNGSPSA